MTHDRYFLDNVAGWILELDRGHGIPWKGNYSSWLGQKQQRLAQEEKARIPAPEDAATRAGLAQHVAQGAARPRASRASTPTTTCFSQEMERAREEREIYIAPGPRLGDVVIHTEDVAKAFGDNLLYEDLTIDVPPGAIVGIIGPNGAGKTTLFRMIVGQETPDEGTVTVGDTVELAYVDQSRDDLDPDKTVWEEISEGNEQLKLGDRLVNSRAYVSRFNFGGTDQQKKVGGLSGGERNRVHLAKLLKSGANVLLLDEPSNDLDVNTLRALEDALETFAGSALIISHDRWFLDRVATHILAFEGDSQVVWYPGQLQRIRRGSPPAPGPRRRSPPSDYLSQAATGIEVQRLMVN